MRSLVLIPHYRHPNTIAKVVEAMLALGLECLIVDDGSDDETCFQILKALESDRVKVLYLPENGGKGAAVKAGLHEANQAGYTHILQVDADAQHALVDALTLLDQARQYPEAVVCAWPIYGEDAPKSRLYGRKISNFWLAINTLSFDIKDGMCGFRVYPVQSACQVLSHFYTGNRMDFDLDILMGLHRLAVPFVWIKTPVSYDIGGVSHFRAFRDNVMISKMHARWFFNMLKNLPSLLSRKLKK